MRNAIMIATTLSLGAALVLALPLAGALAFGTDAAGTTDLAKAGAHAAYGQTWVGTWVKTSGWAGFENDLRTISAQGATPVVMWYYWGDSISVNCVKYGCNGLSKSQWDSMANEMATHAKNVLGSQKFLVVLEPEFNKNGISSWDTFDGYLAAQSYSIKSIAPNAKTVVGFGSWGGYDIFDRAVAASDYTGFQLMRASTRNSASEATGAADSMIQTASAIHAKFAKPIIVFDLAIATYGGWETVQKTALQNVGAKSAQLANAGVTAIVWRYVFDNHYSSGYFGAAESTWGVKYASGAPKAAWTTFVALVQGGTVSAGTTTTGTTTTPTSTFGVTWNGVTGNEWWIQASPKGTQTITRVDASLNGGAWTALDHQSWGGFAKSLHAAPGTKVQFRATSTTGATAYSTAYAW